MSGPTDKGETSGSRPATASSDDEHLRRSEGNRRADVWRSTARLKVRDAQIEVLERVLVRTVVMHQCVGRAPGAAARAKIHKRRDDTTR